MMARRTAHAMASALKPQGRDAIWAAIRVQRIFTRRSLRDATDIPAKTITDYLECLVASGHVQVVDLNAPGPFQYSLVRDTGVETPRLRKDGSEVTQGLGVEQLWRTMKMLMTFTASELRIAASTPDVVIAEATAKTYCTMLARAKYLAVISGKAKPTRYRFARNTGPKPPQIQRLKTVFDPNTRTRVMFDDRGDLV